MECSSFMKEEKRKIIRIRRRPRIRKNGNITNEIEQLKYLAMDSVLFLSLFFGGGEEDHGKIIYWLQEKLQTLCQPFSACKFIKEKPLTSERPRV